MSLLQTFFFFDLCNNGYVAPRLSATTAYLFFLPISATTSLLRLAFCNKSLVAETFFEPFPPGLCNRGAIAETFVTELLLLSRHVHFLSLTFFLSNLYNRGVVAETFVTKVLLQS